MSGERVLYGVAGSPGIGMGHALVYREKPMGSLEREVTDVKLELERYHNAVETFCRVTEAKADRVAEMAGKEQGDIIRCQSAMIRDPYLNGQVEGRIASRQSAEEALSASCDLFIDLFTASDDEVTRQRAADVRDLRGAMLRLLLGLPETDFSALKPGTVLLAEELSPSAVSVRCSPLAWSTSVWHLCPCCRCARPSPCGIGRRPGLLRRRPWPWIRRKRSASI